MTTNRDEPLRIRNDEIAWRRVENEIIVLDLRRNAYLSISETGIDLWERLAEGATPAELEGHLLATYEVEPGRASIDVDEFLDRLRQAELLG
jgi:hypothetical protein